MAVTKVFKFRLAGFSIVAPSHWHKPPLLKRLMYPTQPELCGPGGAAYEFLWFDKPITMKAPLTEIELFDIMKKHLEASVEVRGNKILSKGEISIDGNRRFPTITFEKHRHRHVPTIMKRYCYILNGKFYTIGARLSHNSVECFSEEGYDIIVQSIKAI